MGEGPLTKGCGRANRVRPHLGLGVAKDPAAAGPSASNVDVQRRAGLYEDARGEAGLPRFGGPHTGPVPREGPVDHQPEASRGPLQREESATGGILINLLVLLFVLSGARLAEPD